MQNFKVFLINLAVDSSNWMNLEISTFYNFLNLFKYISKTYSIYD